MNTTQIILALVAPAVILIGICVSSYLVIRQIKMNYHLTLRNKALSYSLYNNEHLRDSRLKIEEAFGPMFDQKEPFPGDKIKEKIEKDQEVLPAIMTLLAHWENMALAIDARICDGEVCFEMVASTLNQHVRIFRNFIDERRERNPRVYYHLIELKRSWEERLSEVQICRFPPLVSTAKIQTTRDK